MPGREEKLIQDFNQ